LKLADVARNVRVLLRQAKGGSMGCEEFLLELTDAKLQARAESRLHRRIKESTFSLLKPLETFDFEAMPVLDMRLFQSLLDVSYIPQRRNAIFLDRSGTGKTHMATALGIEACRGHDRTRFVTCYGLFDNLTFRTPVPGPGGTPREGIADHHDEAGVCQLDPGFRGSYDDIGVGGSSHAQRPYHPVPLGK